MQTPVARVLRVRARREMHEYARGLPYPLLDTQLIILMHRLGYTSMKVVGNRLRRSGTFSGGLLPDQVVDERTNSSRWVPVPRVLARGLGWPREQLTWWDYHMRLRPRASVAQGTRARDEREMRATDVGSSR